MIDNNELPVTNLFLTVIKGYVGYFNRPYPSGNNTNIQVGWEHNYSTTGITGWWSLFNTSNRDDLVNYHIKQTAKSFYYTLPLSKDQIIKGDICEWNDYEQKEYVISQANHKISFNPNIFNDASNINLPNGYTYIPHFPIQVRKLFRII